jgi:hypothetical protein
VGLTTVEEILKANANGFTVTNRAGGAGTIATNLVFATQNAPTTGGVKTTTKDFFPTANGKYLGFSPFDDTQGDGGAGNDDATHLFGKSFTTSQNRTRENINKFRHAN